MNRAEPSDRTGEIACWVLAGLVVLGLIALGVRLKYLQVETSAQYSYANARQSVRRVQTEGVRGRILDRKGRPFAENRRTFAISCDAKAYGRNSWEGTFRALTNAIASLSVILGRPVVLSDESVRRHVRQSLPIPLSVWNDVDETTLARFAEHSGDFPGFFIRESFERAYPRGRDAAHLIGTVRRDRGLTESGDVKFHFFQLEMRGRSGLERYYDEFLRGVPGEKRIVVDARGFAISEETVLESRIGPDLTLTIDADIQRAVAAQLEGEKGACVVLDPRTGDVLALASAPCFDPNDLVPVIGPAAHDRYWKDPAKPLFNRACDGRYTPGSTFKPITALAALSLGVPPNLTCTCEGVFRYNDFRLRCARRWGHGELALREALQESCNVYFCEVGMDVGTNAICRTAAEFGLGRPTGIDFGIDKAGVVPDGAWKKRKYGTGWVPGDLAQMSIGQGMLLVTPLQMARVAGALGTGFLVKPRLKADLPVERRALPFPKKDLDVVREGLRLVVEKGGGKRAGVGVPVTVAGKTGTAEVGEGGKRRKNTWFIAYAPAENPSVAMALVVEDGASGGETAAPRVAGILKAVFDVR